MRISKELNEIGESLARLSKDSRMTMEEIASLIDLSIDEIAEVNPRQISSKVLFHNENVNELAAINCIFHNDSEPALYTGDTDGRVIKWCPISGKKLQEIATHSSSVIGIWYDNTREKLISFSSKCELIWFDVYSNQKDQYFEPDRKNSASNAYFFDGKILWYSDNSIKIFDTRKGNVLLEREFEDGDISCISYSHSISNFVFVSKCGKLFKCNSDFELIADIGISEIKAMENFSKSNIWIVSDISGTIYLINEELTDSSAFYQPRNTIVNHIIFDKSSGKFFLANDDRVVRSFNLRTKQFDCEFRGHKKWVTSICFDKNCEYIFSTSEDGTLRCWDLSNSENIWTSFNGVKSATFRHTDNEWSFCETGFECGYTITEIDIWEREFTRTELIRPE